MKTSIRAEGILLGITAIWGATFPLMHNVIHLVQPGVFVFYRFILGALLLLPFVWKRLFKWNLWLLLVGVGLGFLNAGTYFCQTISLETISASRAAFITGSGVVMVPFLLPLFFLGKPRVVDVTAGGICLIGLYVLTGASFHEVQVGDFWVLLGALFMALQIVAIQWVSRRMKDYALLAFYQIVFTVPFAYGIAMHESFAGLRHLSVVMVVIYCGVLATAFAFYMQTRYQQYTTAPKAALIFALEPVFALIFAVLFNHARIPEVTWIGGALMLLSVLIPDLVALAQLSKRQR